MSELVSYVIPTYNDSPDHLRQAVSSALNQTHPSVEVIVVDDASPDGTAAVAAAFAAEGVDAARAAVTPSDRPDLADFQSNGALAAAKAETLAEMRPAAATVAALNSTVRPATPLPSLVVASLLRVSR